MRLLRAAGFDGVKLDGCGAELDPQLWHELLLASGVPVVIENAHNGATAATQVPWGTSYADAAGCPFHVYRSSSDLRRRLRQSGLQSANGLPPCRQESLGARVLGLPGHAQFRAPATLPWT